MDLSNIKWLWVSHRHRTSFKLIYCTFTPYHSHYWQIDQLRSLKSILSQFRPIRVEQRRLRLVTFGLKFSNFWARKGGNGHESESNWKQCCLGSLLFWHSMGWTLIGDLMIFSQSFGRKLRFFPIKCFYRIESIGVSDLWFIGPRAQILQLWWLDLLLFRYRIGF